MSTVASTSSSTAVAVRCALAVPLPHLRLAFTLPFNRGRPSASRSLRLPPASASLVAVEEASHQEYEEEEEMEEEREEGGFSDRPFLETFSGVDAYRDMRSLPSPELEVKELEELPEQWRRSKVAWLCKELPSYKHSTFVRILNAQRKWITQEDTTYVAVHCMRIRENEAAFRVYKWMSQQHWFRFDFALVTKLADYLGKEGKNAKCRDLFDSIIIQGQVPSESTFHILIVAYLSAPVKGCLDEACSIYNKMIQLGGYRPCLSLHNSVFRALLNQNGGKARHYLRQAEFIYHNIVTSELEVSEDIRAGLIWLHSFQEKIDIERIVELREELRIAGISENKDVLLSIMRSYSKIGDVEETEKSWLKLLGNGSGFHSQALVYRMDLYAKVGEPMKSLEIFKSMKKQNIPISPSAYLKIIEVMSKANEIEIVEKLLDEFIESKLKPLVPAFLDVISMFFILGMHDKVAVVFSKCLAQCCPNRSIYNIYLESLVKHGNLEKAEGIFNEMHTNGTIGTNARSCNNILECYIAFGEFAKAEQVYDIMRQKKYDIKPESMEKLQEVVSLRKKIVRRKLSMKLDEEQREILVGLLLGGVRIESDKERKNHIIHFEFKESSDVHSSLRGHIHERFYEWLTLSSRSVDEINDMPYNFSTIAHSYFGFFADHFYFKGRPIVPKLIHRWLSPCVLAYWYMYGGLRISSGDILLKIKGESHGDIEMIAKAFQAKSLACKMKKKGRTIWLGFQGSNSNSFWKLVEPYMLESVKGLLEPHNGLQEKGMEENKFSDSENESEFDDRQLLRLAKDSYTA